MPVSASCLYNRSVEDEYSLPAAYGAGKHTVTKMQVGTRYVLVGVRTLVDPGDAADVEKVHALQDAIKVEQPGGPREVRSAEVGRGPARRRSVTP